MSTLNGVVVENRTRYDAGSRVKAICQQVSDGATAATGVGQYWEPVARQSYNGIGELTQKTLGCGIQTIDYTYQMRGWLTRMNDPANLNQGFAPADKHFFAMKLSYDGVGNIQQWDYRHAQTNYGPPYDLTQQGPYHYQFSYFNLNRLMAANQTNKAKLAAYSYDANDILIIESGRISAESTIII